uniref:Uncharacterized protein n=1 Tax=Megaselia scalaris TaxID=36166 RepID=T1GB16_MEGSC
VVNLRVWNRGTFHQYTNSTSERIEENTLAVKYEDGKWSKPYYDCGGGNIWMLTYTVPFFGYENGTYFFKYIIYQLKSSLYFDAGTVARCNPRTQVIGIPHYFDVVTTHVDIWAKCVMISC